MSRWHDVWTDERLKSARKSLRLSPDHDAFQWPGNPNAICQLVLPATFHPMLCGCCSRGKKKKKKKKKVRSWKEGEGEREEARIKYCLITKDSAMQVSGGAREPFNKPNTFSRPSLPVFPHSLATEMLSSLNSGNVTLSHGTWSPRKI